MTAYPSIGAVAMSVAMAAWFAVLVRRLRVRRTLAAHEATLVVAISVAFLAMASGGCLVVCDRRRGRGVIVFGSAMGLTMVGEVGYLVRACYREPHDPTWTDHAAESAPGGTPAPSVPGTTLEPR